MNEQERAELQDPESWEWKNDVAVAKRERRARAVVSVSFPAADFERVEQFARTNGRKMSDVIRQAALDYISGGITAMQPTVVSGGGAIQMTAYFDRVGADTLGAGSRAVEDLEIRDERESA